MLRVFITQFQFFAERSWTHEPWRGIKDKFDLRRDDPESVL
jgi:hypothetical protein